MVKRVLLAGFLAALAMFAWTSIAHMALPLGELGIKTVPNEASVLTAMHASMGANSGFYFFPAPGTGPGAMDHYGEKLAANPSGILIYHPPGGSAVMTGQLIIEFCTELVKCLLVVLLLSLTRLDSFGARLGFVVTAGVFAAIATNVSYWNWYGFPALYTFGYMTTEILAFFFAGLVIAAMLRNRGQASLASAA